MTGRELITYILNNRLENDDVFGGEIFRFMTVDEMAEILSVGPHTIMANIEMGRLPYMRIGGVYAIPYFKEGETS